MIFHASDGPGLAGMSITRPPHPNLAEAHRGEPGGNPIRTGPQPGPLQPGRTRPRRTRTPARPIPTRPNTTPPDPARPGQTRPDSTRPRQTCRAQPRRTRTRPGRTRTRHGRRTWTRPHETRRTRTWPHPAGEPRQTPVELRHVGSVEGGDHVLVEAAKGLHLPGMGHTWVRQAQDQFIGWVSINKEVRRLRPRSATRRRATRVAAPSQIGIGGGGVTIPLSTVW